MCEACWRQARGGEPTRLIGDEAGACCFCGGVTESGIYVRANPEFTHCEGKGPLHDNEED